MQASVSGASVKGLKGCKTLNKDPDPKNPVEGTEERYHTLVSLYQKSSFAFKWVDLGYVLFLTGPWVK